MFIRERSHQRPVQLGSYPLEALRRDPAIIDIEAARPHCEPEPSSEPVNDLARTARDYIAYFNAYASGEASPVRAPVPDDRKRRTDEILGAAYYLDATHAGVCAMPAQAWHKGADQAHSHAIVILIAFGRDIEADNLAHEWVNGAQADIARMRALEIAVCLAGHIRILGFEATTHCTEQGQVDLERLAILAGVARRNADNQLASPFVGTRFSLAVVTTSYELTTDLPLAADANVQGFRHWIGINGATSGREHKRQARRKSHLSRYPMEQVKRVDVPTTAIFADEIPRVPARANFFLRARAGDLGPKAQREVARFAWKQPLTQGMTSPLRCMVPHQDGPVKDTSTPGLDNAQANTRAIKALAYHLGVDLAGICEIPEYAWYSHLPNGKPITPYHRYAVVMLIDQGYDTMEGASGDDWISGCQSMRGYMRGAEIAGIMAQFLRSQGFPARSQTNADSHVLQIPLVLLAGLGELSRIGELVLNPFVGPRFKSVVLTTDLPLVPDKPIDFGLQYFCSNCHKCARECPVNAIPFGDKVMFNGYEIWKPDVERCVRYRVTNAKGSACGRCMKTCPLNKVVTADGSVLHRVGTWLGINAMWLKPLLVPIAVALDDKLGFGRRNPIKRWWLDLELVDGVAQIPKGTNERDLDVHADVSGAKSPVGYYHASDMPAPDAREAVPANHKAAIGRAALIETVEEAKARRARGGARPAHYIAVTELPD